MITGKLLDRGGGVGGARRVEQLPPGADVGTAAQEGPALALGHATPDAELDAVVQCVGQALGPDRAAHADRLRPVLRRAGDEQVVRVGGLAGRTSRTVVVPAGVETLHAVLA